MKDFFISYTSTDQQWAEWIAYTLEGEGYSTIIQSWDFQPGSNFLIEMDKATSECERTIAVISPDYLASNYTASEWAAAFRRDPTGNRGLLIPVRIRAAELTGLLGAIVYIDLVDLGEEAARARLLSGISAGRRSKPTTVPQMPGRKYDGDNIPTGFKLRHVLKSHGEKIAQITWSPDGMMLTSLSLDGTAQIWNAETGQLFRTRVFKNATSVTWSISEHVLGYAFDNDTIQLWNVETDTVKFLSTSTEQSNNISIAVWSPKEQILALASADTTIKLLDVETEHVLHTLAGHSGGIRSLAWSPDGEILASGARDQCVRLWEVRTGKLLQTLVGHQGDINSIVWLPGGETLASSSDDGTIRLWDTKAGLQKRILEDHTGKVISISTSSDGLLLASKSHGGTIRLWRSDIWETVEVFNEPSHGWLASLSFHPNAPILATISEMSTSVHVWGLDLITVINTMPAKSSVQYVNAKVVLVGDTGVGKSGLGLVLTGQPFVPTESTHGRQIWVFDNREVDLSNGQTETHEILLWDLAGQPGYRLIHQLHLNEATTALVVFDVRSEIDPFAGVYYWARALYQVQRVQSNSALKVKKFLVAARMDRDTLGASQARIQSLKREMGFDGYVETSAKEGRNIAELAAVIRKSINWDALPRVRSTNLFQQIKSFLMAEKNILPPLTMIDDLYHLFLLFKSSPPGTEELRAQFETGIKLLESQGLIRKLSFGNLVLLQPELLDNYATALANAVKDEPDGLGSIAEEKVYSTNFFIPQNKRLKDKDQEKLLLISIVEDLLRHELILREPLGNRMYLIFPSQSTRENPDLPDPERKTVVFSFEGPILNIFATLTVRISHSGIFKKKELWKNAVIYTTGVGGTFGIFLENTGEGKGRLTLFFKAASEEMCFLFEDFVREHLEFRALSGSINRKRIFVCNECGFEVTNQLFKMRAERGFNWLTCPVCGKYVSLLDKEERLTVEPPSQVSEMNYAADAQRVIEANTFIVNVVKEFHMQEHKGDNVMGEKPTYSIGDISNSTVSGVVQGENNTVITNLNSSGQAELAQALKTLTEAVIASKDLPGGKKEEQVQIINQLGKEASEPKPNKTMLKILIDGLMTTLKAVPDIASAVTSVAPVLTSLHL